MVGTDDVRNKEEWKWTDDSSCNLLRNELYSFGQLITVFSITIAMRNGWMNEIVV